MELLITAISMLRKIRDTLSGGEYDKESKEIDKIIADFEDPYKIDLLTVEVCRALRARMIEEEEYAYADFTQYKIDYLGVDPEYAEDDDPADEFRYGMERCINLINEVIHRRTAVTTGEYIRKADFLKTASKIYHEDTLDNELIITQEDLDSLPTYTIPKMVDSGEYIKKDDTIKIVRKFAVDEADGSEDWPSKVNAYLSCVEDEITALQTYPDSADSEEGVWIEKTYLNGITPQEKEYTCSRCNWSNAYMLWQIPRFCPHCGKKMSAVPKKREEIIKYEII